MTRKRILIAASAIALVAAGAFAVRGGSPAAQALLFPHRHNDPERLVGIAKVVLNLTDAQETQIRGIIEKRKAEAMPLLRQVFLTHQAIQEAVEAGKTDTATLQPLADQAGRTIAQLALIKAQGTAEALAVLNPEQREKARKLHDQFRDNFRERWLAQ